MNDNSSGDEELLYKD